MSDIINMTITTPPAVNMTIATQVGASQSITGFGIKGDKGDAGDPATNLVTSVAGKTGAVTLDKTDVGLSNVDNLAPADMPVSTATQTALDGKQDKDATLTALAAHNTNGILTQTAADTFTGRTITGTANQVSVTNGNGVAGNPTLSLPQNIHTGASPTFAGATLQSPTAAASTMLNVNANATGNRASITLRGYNASNSGDAFSLEMRTEFADAVAFVYDNSTATYHNMFKFYYLIDTVRMLHTVPSIDSTYTLGTSSLYWQETYTDRLFLNSTATLDGSTAGEIKGTGIFTADNIKRGTGSPEGVVTAPVGTYYTDTAITNGAMRWAKKAGTGNTGWQVVDGDTGRRDVASLLNPTHWTATPNILCVRRVGNLVTCEASPSSPGAVVVSGSTTSLFDMPLGFRPKTTSMAAARNASSGFVGTFEATNYGTYETRIRVGTAVPGQGWQFTLVYFTNDPWPTTLPGTAA